MSAVDGREEAGHGEHVLLLFLLLCIGTWGCALEPEPEATIDPAAQAIPELPDSHQAAPRALRLVFWQSQQAAAGPEYALVDGHEGWIARNRTSDFQTRFSQTGEVSLSSMYAPDGYEGSLHFGGVGRAENIESRPLLNVAPQANRIDYEREGITEWYVNGPHGLEHGFSLTERPTGEGPLVLQIAVRDGLAPELDGHDVSLQYRGASVLHYRELFVTDAVGTELDAVMKVEGRQISLEVDDAQAVYPVTIDPWIQQAKLVAADTTPDDSFASDVAISGDTALVGASTDAHGGPSAGSAYIFVRMGEIWTEQAKLTAADAGSFDYFGDSVALSGNTALVGASQNGVRGTGGAYVFVRTGTSWTQQAKLLAPDGDDHDFFGRSVSISGDRALVGAHGDDDRGDGAGSAYVFLRTGTTWTQEAKLHAPDGVALDQFGDAVSMTGETALVSIRGRGGAAYVFVLTGAGWVPQARLAAPATVADDGFAYALAISENSAVIGAPGENGSTGSAYIFVRSGETWTQQARLTATGGSPVDQFGQDVALFGDTALIGAHTNDDAGLANAGSAYLFVRTGTRWTQQRQLMASDPRRASYFGRNVSLSDDTALIAAGALGPAGAAYLFRLLPPQPCTTAAECASGFCADGFCCNTLCGRGADDCLACAAALTGGTDGRCAPIDPGSACGEGPTECSDQDSCDDAGICQANDLAAGLACGDVATTPCDAADRCDGAGRCDASFARTDTPCGADASVCSAQDTCADGICLPNHLSDGTACETGAYCTSGDSCTAGTCFEGTSSPCAAELKCVEDTMMCVLACGDGIVDEGESCDDGPSNSNVMPNACRLDCSRPTCGDGVLDMGEACDDGSLNSDTWPNACRTDCVLAHCGDAIIDDGESCDNGMLNSNSAPNACRTHCRLARCGDGVLDIGESCDEGERNSDTRDARCRTSCALASCGNGALNDGEQCDAGDDNSDDTADGCRTTCLWASCGDGILDTAETCDDGPRNSDVTANACRTHCMRAGCGDGVIDDEAGAVEECDDGDANSDSEPDACRTTCTEAICGDGVVDAHELCDEGEDNGDGSGDTCSTRCTAVTCGNGVQDSGEECDDGERNSDTEMDACRLLCVSPACGDGVVDTGESCDDASATCSAECTRVDPGLTDGAVSADRGVSSDGGVSPDGALSDGGKADSGGPDAAYEDTVPVGCGCRASTTSSPANAWLTLWLVGSFLRRRR